MKANIYNEGHATREGQLNGGGNSTSPKPKAAAKSPSAKWRIAALLLLSGIPLAAGVFRLAELTGRGLLLCKAVQRGEMTDGTLRGEDRLVRW